MAETESVATEPTGGSATAGSPAPAREPAAQTTDNNQTPDAHGGGTDSPDAPEGRRDDTDRASATADTPAASAGDDGSGAAAPGRGDGGATAASGADTASGAEPSPESGAHASEEPATTVGEAGTEKASADPGDAGTDAGSDTGSAAEPAARGGTRAREQRAGETPDGPGGDDAVTEPASAAAPEAEPAAESGAEPASARDGEPASDADAPAASAGHGEATSESGADARPADEPHQESEVPDAATPSVDDTADPAARPALPRVVLTADSPVDRAGSAVSAGRELAEEGNYVLLAVPAEAAEVSTTATVTKGGVLRVLNVPVDADAAAEISVARAEVAALAGPGLVTGLRRRFARRKLASVRARVWETAAADPEWSARCEAAYQPYVEAFDPAARTNTGRSTRPEGVVVGVGPTNMAGQGYAWARAVERKLSGVRAETFSLSSGNTFGFAADRSISTDDWLSRSWQLGQLAYILDHFTHVLAECAMPPFGRLNGPWANYDIAELDAAGIAVALAFHGSEIRDPAAQRARVPFSPFDPAHELTRALQSKVDRLAPVVRAMDVPKFVSTPDLLHDVPDATWLPVVVDPDVWATDTRPLERERPVVVHAPSSPFTKGTGLIEPVVERMHDAGLIEYRRIKGVPHAEMPALLADADIVLDQFVFGSYGVMSVQAMAAGRVTVCYLHDSVAEHLPADVPIVNADPDTLGAELERILAERDEAGRLAARGPAYVRENHDGGRSARVLADFLGVTP
ncbi:hypothetical protein LO772_21580 [Yinghuangia sp. ASG 101]|uniref:hypothetical protein n=1 Tax=Yinghuangia sp. ASG 101 TaxID=2896848 RepID=UPI001E6485B8|nr:hypothetical protein [Yinghuangia sp. ASG 101]UGQ09522.1 hypothetical protein LO772_21580 [Yinghuangia sp. ASG 101]